jgi:hypothetical protein
MLDNAICSKSNDTYHPFLLPYFALKYFSSKCYYTGYMVLQKGPFVFGQPSARIMLLQEKN